jgi:hypothetical protein
LSYDERIVQLYNEAYKRAEERSIDGLSLMTQSIVAFRIGMQVALGQEHLIDIPSIVEKLKDVKSETNFGFAFVCGVMAVLEAIKGKGYKASWQAEGEDSALYNIKRKYDRLKAQKGTEPGALSFEDRPTTAADLAVYGIKLTTWFNEFDPVSFKAWIKEVQQLVTKQEASQDGNIAKKAT